MKFLSGKPNRFVLYKYTQYKLIKKYTFFFQAEFGNHFLIGGGFDDNEFGFIGCLRHINLLGTQIQLDMDGVEQKEVYEDMCVIDDKCVPNPCQHGGLCKQNSTAFTCECENGYWGPLCHTSINYRSCHDFALANPDTRYVH